MKVTIKSTKYIAMLLLLESLRHIWFSLGKFFFKKKNQIPKPERVDQGSELCWRCEIWNDFNNIFICHFISKQFHFIIAPRIWLRAWKRTLLLSDDKLLTSGWKMNVCLGPPAPKCQRNRYADKCTLSDWPYNSGTTVFCLFQVHYNLNLKACIFNHVYLENVCSVTARNVPVLFQVHIMGFFGVRGFSAGGLVRHNRIHVYFSQA